MLERLLSCWPRYKFMAHWQFIIELTCIAFYDWYLVSGTLDGDISESMLKACGCGQTTTLRTGCNFSASLAYNSWARHNIYAYNNASHLAFFESDMFNIVFHHASLMKTTLRWSSLEHFVWECLFCMRFLDIIR